MTKDFSREQQYYFNNNSLKVLNKVENITINLRILLPVNLPLNNEDEIKRKISSDENRVHH